MFEKVVMKMTLWCILSVTFNSLIGISKWTFTIISSSIILFTVFENVVNYYCKKQKFAILALQLFTSYYYMSIL